ncbi:MAG TPA: dethiobiotin synthase [Tepidisphaeraceae bacterium]|jgi:dethiobiotin synthetase|nr:dethiobiotin synthase [Tepidisphaeraceae bacterium]
MLARCPIPGLFITGTDTGVGKTLVAAAIANWFVRRGVRAAVCKPLATGCVHRREGLVSEDAEFLAHHAQAKFSLNTICPQRFAEPLAPAVAAQRAKQKIEWNAIDSAIQMMARQSDVLIVEGIGGILVPVDKQITVRDMAKWLGLPAVIVARPGMGTINHTLLTVEALRQESIAVAGVVMNQYPPETPPAAEESNPRAIERWGDVPILCLVPQFSGSAIPNLPADVVSAIDPVDWLAKAQRAD